MALPAKLKSHPCSISGRLSLFSPSQRDRHDFPWRMSVNNMELLWQDCEGWWIVANVMSVVGSIAVSIRQPSQTGSFVANRFKPFHRKNAFVIVYRSDRNYTAMISNFPVHWDSILDKHRYKTAPAWPCSGIYSTRHTWAMRQSLGVWLSI